MKKFLIIFMLLLISGYTCANQTVNTSLSNGDISSAVLAVINFLNAIWLPFAILAGKLFTNDFVYGSFLHLDVILWKVWNFSKTIANYALAFILFFSIFGLFIGKVKNIGNTLLKLGLAAILINMSWFLLGALIDISTTLLISVGSFPLKIINQTDIPSPQPQFCEQVNISFSGNVAQMFKCEKSKNINASNFLEKTNSLAGPLVYIGQSILGINEALREINAKYLNSQKKVKDILKVVSIGTMIQLIVVVLFVVPIVILVFIGLVRIFWLWIYIGFSPLIILDQIFGGKMLKNKKEFELKNIIGLIFQPVLIVFAMGISVIFLVGIQSALTGPKSEKGLKELGVCGYKNNALCLQNKKVITIGGNLLNDFIQAAGGVFGYTILFLLSTLVLWSMIKVATKSSELTANISQSVYQFAEDALKAVPIVPVAGGVGVGAIQKALSKRLLKRDFETKAAQQAEALLDRLGLKPKGDIGVGELREFGERLEFVTNFIGWRDELIHFMSNIVSNHGDLVPAYSPNFKQAIYDAFNVLYNNKQRFGVTDKELENIGFLIRKNGKLVRVSSANQLFSQKQFGQFLTGLIKNIKQPSIKGAPNFAQIYTIITSGIGADLTSHPIREIRGE